MNGSSERLSSQEIADVLRERIRGGELMAGDRLPTQAELAKEFGVERPAVRKALQALQEDGLLTNVSRGSPPRVAEAPQPGVPRQTKSSREALVSYLEEAFGATDIRIDCVCFTAETLLWALAEMRTVVAASLRKPTSIRVRCLLPGPDAVLLYPVPVSRPELTEVVQAELHRQIRSQRTTLENLVRHFARDHGIDATVDFLPLPFTPLEKRYVLNGELVLVADYEVGRHMSDELPGVGRIEVFDVRGLKSPLFEFRQDRGGQDTQLVRVKQTTFDALWDSIAARQTLSQ